MSVRGRPSNCSVGVPIDFYWRNQSSLAERDHIESAVEALFSAVQQSPGRQWNPWNTRMLKAEFRGRLRLAAQGRLRPVDQVSGLSDGRWPLYEIRWHGVPVTETVGGQERFGEIEVRLIHGEPDVLGLCAVGLHAHEKVVTGDVRATQNAEIDTALTLLLEGYASNWGITPR